MSEESLTSLRLSFESELTNRRDETVARWSSTWWFFCYRAAPIRSQIEQLQDVGDSDRNYRSIRSALKLLLPMIVSATAALDDSPTRLSVSEFEQLALDEARSRSDFEDLLNDADRSLRRTERALLTAMVEFLDALERFQIRWTSQIAEPSKSKNSPRFSEDLRQHRTRLSREVRALRGRSLLKLPHLCWASLTSLLDVYRLHRARLALFAFHSELLDHLLRVHGVARSSDPSMVGSYPPFETTRVELREDAGTSEDIVIARILEHGYHWGDRLLRKAAVTVVTRQER